ISATYLAESEIDHIISILEEQIIDYQLFIGKTVYTKSIEDQIDTFVQLALAANQVPPIDDIRAEVMNRVEIGLVKEIPALAPIIEKHKKEINKIFGT
ncbi:hypothetical protein J4G37_61485, partial [Microvirga sp. 3-52]|nr:hypothetical protein [Microvirga sp. 3-52]